MECLSAECVDAVQLTSGSSVIWLDGCHEWQYFSVGGVEPRLDVSVDSGTLLGPEGSARQSWYLGPHFLRTIRFTREGIW